MYRLPKEEQPGRPRVEPLEKEEQPFERRVEEVGEEAPPQPKEDVAVEEMELCRLLREPEQLEDAAPQLEVRVRPAPEQLVQLPE